MGVASMITAIGRVRIEDGFTEADAATEVKATFGEGGNPLAPIAEEYLGFVNTPATSLGYVRVKVKKTFGAALDYIKSIGGAITIELLSVEWSGQEMYQVGLDAEGNPEWLGMINGVPMKSEEELIQ